MPNELESLQHEDPEKWAAKVDIYVTKAKLIVTDGFLKIGLLLKEIRDKKLYWHLGHMTFTDYLGSKDFSRMTAYKCMQVHDLYVEKYGVPLERLSPIGIEKLFTIRHMVQEGKDVAEWLATAESLSIKDLRYEVKRVKAGLPENPEEITRIQNLMMPKLLELTKQVPSQYWSKVYYREPVPGVIECILRISINDEENDD